MGHDSALLGPSQFVHLLVHRKGANLIFKFCNYFTVDLYFNLYYFKFHINYVRSPEPTPNIIANAVSNWARHLSAQDTVVFTLSDCAQNLSAQDNAVFALSDYAQNLYTQDTVVFALADCARHLSEQEHCRTNSA